MGHFEKFQQQKNLQKDETIIAYADGTRKRKSKSRSDTGAVANGVLILTNFQLIFFRSGIIGTTTEKYPLNEITSTSYKTGVMSNTITVNLQNQTFDFGGNKKKIEALYEKLDNRNDLASAPADTSSAGSSDAPAERVESATPTPSNSPPPERAKALWVIGGILLFFIVVGIFVPSTPEEKSAEEEISLEASKKAKEAEELKIESERLGQSARIICRAITEHQIKPLVPDFSMFAYHKIFDKGEGRYIVKETFKVLNGSLEYTFHCDITYKGSGEQLEPSNWTFNHFEIMK